ncbi:GGDEF domain-containing protein [Arabiibacter massiliensis]|uniref:GGDEF domain-containing protein n=1 Tax=Arabiibacter massiliensis TaxID=1870985 RepID=UPI000B424365|nr:GGDEF domain-containing protein [Arabiibacter massiliensis]
MSGIAYLQVDAITVLVLAILLVNSALRLPYSQTNKLFRILVVLLMAASACDAVSWTCDGWAPAWALYGVNVALGLLSGAVSFTWFLYVCAVAFDYEAFFRRRLLIFAVSLPALAFGVVALSAPWTHALFTIDGTGHYQEGTRYYLLYALGYSYVVAASAIALVRAARETFPWKRRRLYDLAAFVVPPFFGAVLQVVLDGIAVLLPSMALSVLLVYVALQRDEISLDGLTGLSNRASLESTLEHRCGEAASQPWCLVMLDIDQFKWVNDRYGHVAGDEVLRTMAHALKIVFGRKSAFLARFGGDEFVVLYDGAGEDEARGAIAEVARTLESLWTQRGWFASVGFSAGYAPVAKGERCDPEELLERADALMYRDKQRERQDVSRG